jgi:serine/threonine protein kinase
VIHRDLKSLNVVLGADFQKHRRELSRLRGEQIHQGHFEVKICDFGLTRAMESSHLTITQNKQGGSPRYMAPEIYSGLGTKMSEKVDVYAMGCILFEVFGGGFPHGDCRHMRDICIKVFVTQNSVLKFNRPERVPVMVIGLVEKLTKFDPGFRPTCAAALETLRLAQNADPNRIF